MFDVCLTFMRSIQRQTNHLLFVWCDSWECLYLSSWLLFAEFSLYFSWHRSLSKNRMQSIYLAPTPAVIFPFHKTVDSREQVLFYVAVCLRLHVKHERNTRYSQCFFAGIVCTMHIVYFSINFFLLCSLPLQWIPFTFRWRRANVCHQF